MKVLSLFKEKIKNIKNISTRHFIFSVIAAFVISGIAVLGLPLDAKTLSVLEWIVLFLPALIALFLFFASMRDPRRLVFLNIKRVYYIGTPFILVLSTDIFFDHNIKNIYSENFFSRFFSIWLAIWILGTIALRVLMYYIEVLAEKIVSKENFFSRLIYAFAVMYTPQKVTNKEKNKSKGIWWVVSICMLMVAIAVFIFTVTMFLYNVYSNMEFEAILFTVTFAAGGLAIEDLLSGFALTVFFLTVTGYICYHMIKCFRNDKIEVIDIKNENNYTLMLNMRKRAVHIILSAFILLGSVALFSRQTNFVHYLGAKNVTSSLYDDYYVKPEEDLLEFPEKKRNLIYIFLESMETTYASKDLGGDMDKNYISSLTGLLNDEDTINFSNTEKIGGASAFVPAISHTMGSTVAQTSGIAMNTKIFPLTGPKEFPSITRLEDILHDNGYNQVYIEGSNGEFSMYDKYVGRYDDSKVYDRISLADQGYSDEKADYIWKWGIEDQKLVDITKELITEVSKDDKPFFVTMYTMDTHTFETGHRCDNCDSSIGNDYLASVECSTRSVLELVEWIKQQPFYDNTTIILVGDHLGNQKTAKVDIDTDYTRTTFNCFINSAKNPSNTKNRVFSSLDMFPTALSAIGVEIKGDRLALGTDLFSETKTLCEELGKETYEEQLEQSSDWFLDK